MPDAETERPANLAVVLYRTLSAHSIDKRSAYVGNGAARDEDLTDVILHGHFDLHAIAADLLKEIRQLA